MLDLTPLAVQLFLSAPLPVQVLLFKQEAPSPRRDPHRHGSLYYCF